MAEAKQVASVNLARDLCLKLIERRSLSPEQLAPAMSLLTTSAAGLFKEIEDGGGLWLLRMGRDFTIKLIERGQVAGAQAAALALAENVRMAASVAAKLSRDEAPAALGASRDLVLKMMEIGRLSKGGLAELFEEVALTVAVKKAERVDHSVND